MECLDEYDDSQTVNLTNSSLTLKEFQSSVADESQRLVSSKINNLLKSPIFPSSDYSLTQSINNMKRENNKIT